MATDEHEKEDNGRNRRRYERIPADRLPHLTASVVGGPSVRLLDVSRRGARVETHLPLKPGRSITIKFVAADATLTLSGAVVRSSIAVLAEECVKYHTALSFAEDVHLCQDPGPTQPHDRSASASALSTLMNGQEDDQIMVVDTPDDTGDALRDRLFANTW